MICLAFEEICCGGQLIAWGFSLYRWPNKDVSVSLCDRRILLMKLGHIPFLFLIKTGGDQRRAAALDRDAGDEVARVAKASRRASLSCRKRRADGSESCSCSDLILFCFMLLF